VTGPDTSDGEASGRQRLPDRAGQVTRARELMRARAGLSWPQAVKLTGWEGTDESLRKAVSRAEAREAIAAARTRADPPADALPPVATPPSLPSEASGVPSLPPEAERFGSPDPGDGEAGAGAGPAAALSGTAPPPVDPEVLASILDRLTVLETGIVAGADSAREEIARLAAGLGQRIAAVEDAAVEDGSRLERLEATKTPDLSPQVAEIAPRVAVLEEGTKQAHQRFNETVTTLNDNFTRIWRRLRDLEAKQ